MKLASSLKLIALSAALAMSSMVVMAAADPQQLTIRDIVTQQTQLRSQVTAGKGAFKDMSKAERQALAERQDRVLQMLGGSQTLDEMPPDQRTLVFNDLEWIKAAVTKAEDERLICEYTRTVGSNRMTSVCMTAKEQREYREGSQKSLRTPFKCDECRGD
jgi:hypothetical protein